MKTAPFDFAPEIKVYIHDMLSLLAFRAGCLVLAAFNGLLAACADSTGLEAGREAEGSGPRLTVATTEVRLQETYRVLRRYSGRVEALQSVDLAFEVGGRIEAVLVDAGDRVDAGTALARIDDVRVRARRDETRAARREVLAELDLAQRTLGRKRAAFEAGALEPQSLDETKRRVRKLEARAASLGAAVARLEVDLADTTLAAPFDAIVAERKVDLGAVVEAGAPLFHLVQRRPIEARIAIAGDALAALREVDLLTVNVEGREFAARIRAVVPVRDARTRTLEAWLRIDAELGEAARVGDISRIDVETVVEGAGAWLPRTALTEGTRGLWAVYVVTEDEAIAVLDRREVELMHRRGERVYVNGPLEEGDRVVRGGLQRLVPGLTVQLAEAGDDG